MHYLLFYEVGEDYVTRRAPFREAHLEKAWRASERGELVLAGALTNPVNGAVLLFSGNSPEVAENFAKADPYVTSGTVKRWYVREWTTVAGKDATTPIGPRPIPSTEENQGQASAAARISPQTNDGAAILRMWRGCATAERARDYVQHATQKVFPALAAIDGHRGAYLLRRAVDDAIELVVLTLWESMEAVRKFAGTNVEKAVVEPEAQAVLSGFDDFVTHFEVVQSTT